MCNSDMNFLFSADCKTDIGINTKEYNTFHKLLTFQRQNGGLVHETELSLGSVCFVILFYAKKN